MHSIQTAYYDLANAIVFQAVTDYRKALNGVSYNKKYPPEIIVTKLEKFFRSSWYRTLTKVDGEYLIERIREETLGKEQK